MAKIIYITGGERSGKSSHAQKLALEMSDRPLYMATARTWDEDFKGRINKHKSDRDDNWELIEEEKELSKHDLSGRIVVLDCITLWLNNYFHDSNFNAELSLNDAVKEWHRFVAGDFYLIVVSNEIGMGVHGTTEGARKFVELHGRINQEIASIADEAYLMVSGIPVKIK